jgi:hypothetical protein
LNTYPQFYPSDPGGPAEDPQKTRWCSKYRLRRDKSRTVAGAHNQSS